MDLEEFAICPYNRSHVMKWSRIQIHLVKCEKRYPPLAICPFNATHRMPKEQLNQHIAYDCPTRNALPGGALATLKFSAAKQAPITMPKRTNDAPKTNSDDESWD